MFGSSGDPNCPPYVRKANAVKEKFIEKTDGSTGSNNDGGGDESGNKSTGKESFEYYDNNDNKNDNTLYNPPVDKGNMPMSVDYNSSSKDTQSKDKSNKTQDWQDTSSETKKGMFFLLVLCSLHLHTKRPRSHLLSQTIVINSPSKMSCLL